MSIPDGATHKLRGEFYKEDIDSWHRFFEGKWLTVDQRSWDFVTRHAAPITDKMRQAIAAQSWDGQGMPPVGTVCEMTFDDGAYRWGYWLKTKVLCYGDTMVFVSQETDKKPDEWLEGSIKITGMKFRPIRTPEQIAAAERAKAIEHLAYEIAGYNGFDDPRDVDIRLAEHLHDQNFRKQVAP